MKTYSIVSLVLVLVITSCGKDGMDGKAYLQIRWDPYVYAYWDDNSDTPEEIKYNERYEVFPGIYHYEYLWKNLQGNSFGEQGTYEIFINKGEKGGFLKAGKDGETESFRIHLSEDNGPNHTVKSVILNKKNELSAAETDSALLNKVYISQLEYDTSYSRGFMMVVSKQRFRMRK